MYWCILPLQSLSNGKIKPPSWAQGTQDMYFWYYENEHGEQWVAKILGNELVVAGLDIGWEELRFDLVEIEGYLKLCRRYLNSRNLLLQSRIPDLVEDTRFRSQHRDSLLDVPTIKGIILNDPELFWLISIMTAAQLPLRHVSTPSTDS